MLPVETMHACIAFASELIFDVGATPVDGNAAPGASPVVRFARFATVAAASDIPLLFVLVAPSCAPGFRNCANP